MWLYLLTVLDKVNNKLYASAVFLRYLLHRMGADSEPVLEKRNQNISVYHNRSSSSLSALCRAGCVTTRGTFPVVSSVFKRYPDLTRDLLKELQWLNLRYLTGRLTLNISETHSYIRKES